MTQNRDILKSPLTGSTNVEIFDTFEVEDIVNLYLEQEGINVRNYFSHGDRVLLYECLDTGYRFYYPLEVAGDEAFYQELGTKAELNNHDYDRDWSDDHEFAKRILKQTDRLLEIGCNTGKFLERINNTVSDAQGIEFNPIAVEIATKKGLKVVNETIEHFAENNEGELDIVCAFQVLEHVAEPGAFIESSLKALKNGGKLIFSVPNNQPYFQRFNKYEVLNLPPHHVGLWNLETFEKMAQFFNCKLESYNYFGEATFRGDLYLRAKAIANIKSLPHKESGIEKIKLYASLPLAMIRKIFDVTTKIKNNGFIAVIFVKTV